MFEWAIDFFLGTHLSDESDKKEPVQKTAEEIKAEQQAKQEGEDSVAYR